MKMLVSSGRQDNGIFIQAQQDEGCISSKYEPHLWSRLGIALYFAEANVATTHVSCRGQGSDLFYDHSLVSVSRQLLHRLIMVKHPAS